MKLDENNLPKKIPLGKSTNLEGMQVGQLTVLYRCEYPDNVPHTSAYWVCKCNCGNYTRLRADHIKNNRVKTCGEPECCNPAEDLTNKIFGKLQPLYRVEGKDKKRIFWHCQCECGNELDVRADHLKDGHTTSCGCVLSLGEEKIIKLLIANKIKFQSQKTFEDCKFIDTNAKAKFDFYLPDYNCLIEFDGIQHFYAQETSKIFTKEKLKRTQEHDAFKNQYCLNNNIILIRIPYTHFDNIIIEDLLPATSKFIYAGS